MRPFNKILRHIGGTLLRFPMPVLSGVLAFVFAFIELHFVQKGSVASENTIYIKLFLECMSGISMLIAVDVFSESKNVELSKRIGLYILAFCILGLHYYSISPAMFDSESVFISRYLIFITCFHLSVSFVAFYQAAEIHSFWQYNYFLFLRFITSVAYSATLFTGLAGALWAIGTLFDVRLHTNYYIDLFLFIFLVFNTILFLNSIPRSYQVFVTEQLFKKSIRIFVQYILIPIVLVYLVILYFYLFRILMSQHLPDGWVCIPILICSIVGILAYLLIYPIRNDAENRLIFLYARFFFYILLPLLSLYFIAIIKRIMPYGITEDRYLVFMLGVWLLIISVYILVSRKDNIIIIPVSLFLLLFLSAIGPWGMFQLSVQNQVVRLENLLKRNKMLVNKKLTSPPSGFKVDVKDEASIRSILNYLNKRGEIRKLHAWLGEQDQLLVNDAVRNNELNALNAVFTSIEMKEEPEYMHLFFEPVLKLGYDIPLATGGFKNMARFIRISTESRDTIHVVRAGITADTMVLTHGIDTVAKVYIGDMVQRMLNWQHVQDSLNTGLYQLGSTLKIIKLQSKNYLVPHDSLSIVQEKFRIYLQKIYILKEDSTFSVTNVEGMVLY